LITLVEITSSMIYGPTYQSTSFLTGLFLNTKSFILNITLSLTFYCGNHLSQRQMITQAVNVVATTRQNGTHSLLTSAKLSVGYLVVGIYKRTQQGALAALLLYLYKYKVVCATTICLSHVLLLIHHASTSRPPCHIHVP